MSTAALTTEVQVDARTGNNVWCVSPNGVRADMVYFESRGFTGDGRFVVMRQQQGDTWNFVRYTLATGAQHMLATGVMGSVNTFTVAHDGHTGLFISDGELYSVDVVAGTPARAFADLRTRMTGTLIDTPVALDASDRFVALATARGEDMTLWRYDRHTDEVLQVLEVPGGFSHPLLCPTDPDLMTFVRNGNHCWNMDVPDEQRVRTWQVRVGATQAQPFIIPRRYRTVTHESWNPDGQRMYFFDKNWREWLPASICSVDRSGGDWQVHHTTYTYRLGHGVVSPCGRYFLSDCQERGHSPLILIDLRSSAWEILCWPDASQDGGHAAQAHVHPSFSADGRWIAFTSDREGYPRAYVLPLGDRLLS